MKTTADNRAREDEANFEQQLQQLKSEMEETREAAIAENAAKLECQFKKDIEAKEQAFDKKCKEQSQYYEHELEYRATRMKDSLQIANEVCLFV